MGFIIHIIRNYITARNWGSVSVWMILTNNTEWNKATCRRICAYDILKHAKLILVGKHVHKEIIKLGDGTCMFILLSLITF